MCRIYFCLLFLFALSSPFSQTIFDPPIHPASHPQCLSSHPLLSLPLCPLLHLLYLSPSRSCSTDLREVLLSHLHLLLHQPLPVGRLILEPPLGLLPPPPLLLQHLPPSLRLPLLGASGEETEEQMGRREQKTTGGKRRRGQYVNFRQILQYKVKNCQKSHMRAQVPMHGFVKYIPLVLCIEQGALLM